MGRFHTESLTSVFSGKTGRLAIAGPCVSTANLILCPLSLQWPKSPPAPIVSVTPRLQLPIITRDLFLKNK